MKPAGHLVQGALPLEEYVPAAQLVDEVRRSRASFKRAESEDTTVRVGTVRAKRSAKSIVCLVNRTVTETEEERWG